MFSSLSSFVSPKAWLASYIAKNLAEWLQVEPETIETNLLGQDSKICLRDVQVRDGLGSIDLLELRWSWVSSSIQDVTLHISGVHLEVRKDHLHHQKQNQTKQPEEVGASSASPTAPPPGKESWAATYFQQIVDNLTVQIEKVKVSLEIEKDLSVEVSLDQASLKTLESLDSKLDQSLDVRGLKAVVHKLAVEYPLLRPWNGEARVQRVAGRRFVDGVLTGLLVSGLEDRCTDLLLHAGPNQLQALLALQEWLAELGGKKDSDSDDTEELASNEKTEDASQLMLPFKSIGAVLENGSTISFRDCELRYHFDASVCFILCSGGLCLDESMLVALSHPMLVDFVDHRVGFLKNGNAPDDETNPIFQAEMSVAHLECIVEGLKGCSNVLGDQEIVTTESSEVTEVRTGQPWSLASEDTFLFRWKSARFPLSCKVSGIKAVGDGLDWNLSWKKASVSFPGLDLAMPDLQLNPSNLIFGEEVSVHTELSYAEITDMLLAEFESIGNLLFGGENLAKEEGSSAWSSLPICVFVPAVCLSMSGQQSGEAKLEKLQFNRDASFTIEALSSRGFYKDSVLRASNIQASFSGGDYALKLDLNELHVPSTLELLQPVTGMDFCFKDDAISAKIRDETSVAFIETTREQSPEEAVSFDVEIPYHISLELDKLVVARKNSVPDHSLNWKSLTFYSLSFGVDPSSSSSDGLAMSCAYETIQIETTQNNLRMSLLGPCKTKATFISKPSMEIAVGGTIKSRVTLPSGMEVNIDFVSPQVGEVFDTAGGLPFLFRWEKLSVALNCSRGSFGASIGCLSTQDGKDFALSEALLALSSAEMVASLQSVYEESVKLMSHPSMLQSQTTKSVPVRLRLGSCFIGVQGLGRVKMTSLDFEGLSGQVQDIDVRGFFANSIVHVRSLSVSATTSERGLELTSSFVVAQGSACELCRLASPIEAEATYRADKTIAISVPLLALDVLQDLAEGHKTEDVSSADLPFGCELSIKLLQLRYTPPLGQSDSDLWHSIEVKESHVRLKKAVEAKHTIDFHCKALSFQRDGSSPVIAVADEVGLESSVIPSTSRIDSPLWVPSLGRVEQFELKTGTIRKLVIGGSGSLTAPINNLHTSLEEGKLIIKPGYVEWKLEPSEPGAPPPKMPFVPPIPVQVFLGEGCRLFSTLSTGKVVRLASCDELVGVAEPSPDLQTIKAESRIVGLVYLGIVDVPFLAVSAIVHPERLDVFTKTRIELETIKISADFGAADWSNTLEEDSRLYQLPNVHVSPLKVEMNLEGKVLNIEEALVKFGAFNGNADTDSAALSAHYIKQVKKRIPYFLAKTNVMGFNVGDSASSLAASVALKSTVGGSVVGVVGRDAVGSSISLGKSSRGAESSDRYHFGDFSRGVAASIKHASRAGSYQRGSDQYAFGDFTAGTASAAASYTSENSVRLSSAAGSGLGMAAGMAIAGPVGLVAGAVVGGRSAASAVSGLTGDPKKKTPAHTEQQTAPPDLLDAPAPGPLPAVPEAPPSNGPLTDEDFFASFGTSSCPPQMPGSAYPNLVPAASPQGQDQRHQAQNTLHSSLPPQHRITTGQTQDNIGSRSLYSQPAPPSQAQSSQNSHGYRFGDLTRSVVARGKEKRGKDASSGYKFGDFSRGLFG